MKNKADLQNSELEAINGGISYHNTAKSPCPSCGAEYSKHVYQPKGFLVSYTEHGCSDNTYKYRCPACGYEWAEG